MSTATAATGRLEGVRYVDPRALMALKGLELRARWVVDGFWHGIHKSPKHGFSVEFTEYRPYTPGEDPRFLDWRLYARTDRFYLKRFEDETNLRCVVILDNSRSMGFGAPYSKQEYARTLAATFGYFIYQQGDALGLLVFDEAVRDFLPARQRPGHLRRWMLALERVAEGRGTGLGLALEQLRTLLFKRSLVVVISDFLTPIESWTESVRWLRASGHDVVLFRVQDPGEADLRIEGPNILEDMEDGRRIPIHPDKQRAVYQARMKAHTDRLEELARTCSAGYWLLRTDEPLETALHEFLRWQSSRKSVARVRRGPR